MSFLSIFGANANTTEEDKFWLWFQKHSNEIFHFQQDRENVFNKLSNALAKINPDLTFEFGPVLDSGQREFVISAGGIKSAFPSVESLFDAAPQMPDWTITKFRPRRTPLSDLTFANVTVKAQDVYFNLYPDGNKLGAVLFFDDFSEDQYSIYGNIGYLLLDESLGEYDVETKLGFIEFHNKSSNYFKGARPLALLAEEVDAFYAKQPRVVR